MLTKEEPDYVTLKEAMRVLVGIVQLVWLGFCVSSREVMVVLGNVQVFWVELMMIWK